jgi:adenylate cyclase
MPLEIERKFLLRHDGWRGEVARSIPMRHGYLTQLGSRASVRVRVEGTVGKLNIKAAVVGAARAEYEYDIPVADARELLANLCVGGLDKVRHHVEVDGHTFEVDEFLGANAGLIVAEIELAAADAAFPRPAWLGREVTAEPRYYNHHLALRPYQTWAPEEKQ